MLYVPFIHSIRLRLIFDTTPLRPQDRNTCIQSGTHRSSCFQLSFASRSIPYTLKVDLFAATSSLSLLLRQGAGTWHRRCVHDLRKKPIADNGVYLISFHITIIIYYKADSTVIDSLHVQFSQFLEVERKLPTKDNRGYGYP